MSKVTTDIIIASMKGCVEEKQVISPHLWVDAAQKLNVLQSTETDLLFDLQQKVKQLQVAHIESGDSVAKARLKVEATDEFKDFCKQGARVSQIEEFIRIAKLQARLKDNEYRNQ